MSSSEDEMLGQEVEQELEVQTKPTKKTKLTSSQRLQLIDAYRHGKTDKFYNVVPMKNKPGEYRVIKRKKPLDIPITDNDSDEINMNVEPPHSEKNVKNEPVSEKNVEKKNKIKQEFFTMQNTINNSLSKEIAAVMEKCNKIEAKMKKQKQKMSQRQHQQQYYPEEQYPAEEYPEEEYPEGEPIEGSQSSPYAGAVENRPQEEMYYPRRFNARNRIDLRNF